MAARARPVVLSPEEWRNLISVGQFAATSLVGWYVWMANRDRVRRDELARLKDLWDTRADDHANRLTVSEQRLAHLPSPSEAASRIERLAQVEEIVRHLPTAAAVNEGHARAHARIDGVAAGLAEIQGSIRRIEVNLDLITKHLMDGTP